MPRFSSELPHPVGLGRARSRDLVGRVRAVLDLEPVWRDVVDTDLRTAVAEVRSAVASGELTPRQCREWQTRTFAVVREAARRVLGQHMYPAQVLGGLVIADGCIAEMATGEGKTLTATLPAVWFALHGRGVHVATANDYLATHGADTLRPVYALLGLTVAAATGADASEERAAAYRADITYSTAQQFGFDYLTDNLVDRLEAKVQRGRFAAVVDEADSLLIDEARTPLIISAPDTAPRPEWAPYTAVVAALTEDQFIVDDESETVYLTEDGTRQIEVTLGLSDLHTNPAAAHRVFAALKARALFARGKDYLITTGPDGEPGIVIVDPHTGRPQATRRFQDALHEALEAKEGLRVRPASKTTAAVTLQAFFTMYTHLGGMTGTAMTEAEELATTYRTPVVGVPTHYPVARIDQPDLLYRTVEDKLAAVVAEVTTRQAAGQPVLIGTLSVVESEQVSARLTAAGVPHRVLNARHHAAEATVVAQAGRAGAVTVATNMAGRGVDIRLGGDPAGLAVQEVGPAPTGSVAGSADAEAYDQWRTELTAATERWEKVCRDERQAVLAAGGLYVLGTGRNISRRIDLQLRGRSGRQGEPGESRFFLSCDDDLVATFGGPAIGALVAQAAPTPGAPVAHRMLISVVERAQRKVEAIHAEQRRDLLDYDKVLAAQRLAVYGWRDRVLAAPFGALLERWLDRTAADTLTGPDWAVLATSLTPCGEWPVSEAAVQAARRGDRTATRAELVRAGVSEVRRRFAGVAPQMLDFVLRHVLVQLIDLAWSDHLTDLEDLREAVSLRSYSQQDPRTVYAEAAYDRFTAMVTDAHQRGTRMLWRIEAATRARDVPAEPVPHSSPAEPVPGEAVPSEAVPGEAASAHE
jgi:preprotein translocase subunit SecA